jgi:hypothetical protein
VGATVDPLTISTIATSALIESLFRSRKKDETGKTYDDSSEAVFNEIAELVRTRLATDPNHASALTEVQQKPNNVEQRKRFESTLLDVVVMDDVFAGKLEGLVARANLSNAVQSQNEHEDETTDAEDQQWDEAISEAERHERVAKPKAHGRTKSPVRGFLALGLRPQALRRQLDQTSRSLSSCKIHSTFLLQSIKSRLISL